MDRLLDPGFIGVMIPIVGVVGVFTSLIFRRWTNHRERMAMIDQGLDPDERAKQHDREMEANKATHKERMAMIEQGLDPDERAKQHDRDMEANKAAHKERMAMIEQGMYPDRPELEDDDLEHEPALIER